MMKMEHFARALSRSAWYGPASWSTSDASGSGSRFCRWDTAKTFNGFKVILCKLSVIIIIFTKGTKVSNTIHKHHDHECHHFHIQSQNIRKVDRNKKPRSLILCYCYSMNALSIRKLWWSFSGRAQVDQKVSKLPEILHELYRDQKKGVAVC